MRLARRQFLLLLGGAAPFSRGRRKAAGRGGGPAAEPSLDGPTRTTRRRRPRGRGARVGRMVARPARVLARALERRDRAGSRRGRRGRRHRGDRLRAGALPATVRRAAAGRVGRAVGTTRVRHPRRPGAAGGGAGAPERRRAGRGGLHARRGLAGSRGAPDAGRRSGHVGAGGDRRGRRRGARGTARAPARRRRSRPAGARVNGWFAAAGVLLVATALPAWITLRRPVEDGLAALQ